MHTLKRSRTYTTRNWNCKPQDDQRPPNRKKRTYKQRRTFYLRNKQDRPGWRTICHSLERVAHMKGQARRVVSLSARSRLWDVLWLLVRPCQWKHHKSTTWEFKVQEVEAGVLRLTKLLLQHRKLVLLANAIRRTTWKLRSRNQKLLNLFHLEWTYWRLKHPEERAKYRTI